MSDSVDTHFIARGVCVRDGAILLAHHIEENYNFLPGGHVEPGESMQHALERECEEEFGGNADAGDMITVFEHQWNKKGRVQHEINGIFSFSLKDAGDEVTSKVPHLVFHWVQISELDRCRFLPSEFLPALQGYLDGNSIPRLISTVR